MATQDNNNNHHNNQHHNLHHQQLREELQFKKPMVFRARAFLQKIGLGKSQVIEKEKGKKYKKMVMKEQQLKSSSDHFLHIITSIHQVVYVGVHARRGDRLQVVSKT